jgi:hypothetical protein
MPQYMRIVAYFEDSTAMKAEADAIYALLREENASKPLNSIERIRLEQQLKSLKARIAEAESRKHHKSIQLEQAPSPRRTMPCRAPGHQVQNARDAKITWPKDPYDRWALGFVARLEHHQPGLVGAAIADMKRAKVL